MQDRGSYSQEQLFYQHDARVSEFTGMLRKGKNMHLVSVVADGANGHDLIGRMFR